jgi:hypothetical protein
VADFQRRQPSFAILWGFSRAQSKDCPEIAFLPMPPQPFLDICVNIREAASKPQRL